MSGPRPPVRPPGPPPTVAPPARPPPPTQAARGVGEFKRPPGPPPSGGAPMTQLKPPPMAPPPRDLSNTIQKPTVTNFKGIEPPKQAPVVTPLDLKADAKPVEPRTSSGPRPPPPRGPPPAPIAPPEFQPDSSGGVIKSGLKSAAAPKFSNLTPKMAAKEGAVPMFETPPKPKQEDIKPDISPAAPKAPHPLPPQGPPPGIPENKPLPPAVKPPTEKNAPPPSKPPPTIGKGRAPPPEEVAEEQARKLQKLEPPTNEPPFKRGYKIPKVEEVPIIHRRDKEFPEFEESSSDEEKETEAIKPIDKPSSPMQIAAAASPAVTTPTPKPPTTPITSAVSPAPKPATPSALSTPTAAAAAPPTPTTAQKTPSTPVQAPPTPTVSAPAPAVSTPATPLAPAPMSKPPTVPRPPASPMPLASQGANILVVDDTPASETERPGTAQSADLAQFKQSVGGEGRVGDNMSDISGSVVTQLIAPPPTAPSTGFVAPIVIDEEAKESQLGKKLNPGRLSIRCVEAIGLRKRDDKSKNPRCDPYIKFKLGAADKWPWKSTQVKRKQDMNAKFDNEVIAFDVLNPLQYIHAEDMHLIIEVWNKGTFKDEIIGSVTMSVVRFFKNPYISFQEKVPILGPGDKTSTSKFVFEEARSGMFVFTIYEARKLRNVDPMGQQNPYVQLSVGDYKKRSKTIKGGGKEPYFQEEDVVMWIDQEIWANDLMVKICDEEVGPDNPIGYTQLCLLPYMDMRPSEARDEAFDLFYSKVEPNGAKTELPQGELIMRVQYLPAGKLTVECIKAKGLLPKGRNVPMEGEKETIRLDPYVSLAVDSQAAKMIKRSPVDKDGGVDPVWESKVIFDIVDQYIMDVEVYHQNLSGEDMLIGTGQISLLQVFKAGYTNIWVTLKQQKETGGIRECGDVNLSLLFVGPQAIAYPQYRPGVDSFDDALRKTDPASQDKGKDLLKAKEDESKLVQDILKHTKADAMKPEFTDEEIINAFKFIDLDKNNFIGAAEIRHILVCMGELITDEEIDMMIGMVDLDGDGQVSFDEFRNIVLHPNPAAMDSKEEQFEIKQREIDKQKLLMAGKVQELDAASYARQKELMHRESKKKMLIAFIADHEFDYDNLRLAHESYKDLPKEKRTGGKVNFEQFCRLLQVEPIGENMRLFGLFDPERSGVIDFKEFILSAMNFVDVSRDIRLPYTFQMYDEMNTGYISMQEITQILKGNHMVSVASVQRKAQTIMRQATSNEANAITLKEFMVVTKKFPNIILPNFNPAKGD